MQLNCLSIFFCKSNLKTKDEKYLIKLNKIFSTKNYGDVSGVHRRYLDELSVNKQVIIIREPIAVLKSYLQMGEANYLQTIERLKNGEFVKDFYNILNLVDNNKIPFFRFEDLISELKYWDKLFEILQINDVVITEKDLGKRKNSRPIKHELKDIDENLLLSFKESMKSFNMKFNYI